MVYVHIESCFFKNDHANSVSGDNESSDRKSATEDEIIKIV